MCAPALFPAAVHGNRAVISVDPCVGNLIAFLKSEKMTVRVLAVLNQHQGGGGKPTVHIHFVAGSYDVARPLHGCSCVRVTVRV